MLCLKQNINCRHCFGFGESELGAHHVDGIISQLFPLVVPGRPIRHPRPAWGRLKCHFPPTGEFLMSGIQEAQLGTDTQSVMRQTDSPGSSASVIPKRKNRLKFGVPCRTCCSWPVHKAPILLSEETKGKGGGRVLSNRNRQKLGNSMQEEKNQNCRIVLLHHNNVFLHQSRQWPRKRQQ